MGNSDLRPVADICNAAEIEASVVAAEKQLVANGHQGGSLAAEGHVEGAEVADHRQTRLGSDGIAVAYLRG